MNVKKNPGTVSHARGQKKSRIRKTLVFTALIIATLLIGVGSAVYSKSTQDKNNARLRTPKTPPPVRDGKKYTATKEIIFDQAAGKLRKPTAEETQALVDQISSLTNRSSEGLTLKEHSNGTRQVNLEGRFGSVVLGRANADGTTEIRCVTTMREAVEFLGLEESNSDQQQ
jgi:hypothetical protein